MCKRTVSSLRVNEGALGSCRGVTTADVRIPGSLCRPTSSAAREPDSLEAASSTRFRRTVEESQQEAPRTRTSVTATGNFTVMGKGLNFNISNDIRIKDSFNDFFVFNVNANYSHDYQITFPS